VSDVWLDGERYEAYIGRWSRLVAAEFVTWLDVPDHLRWLEVGCGTGALTASVLAGAEPKEVLALDSSASFVGYAGGHVHDPRVRFRVAEATELAGTPDHDVAVSGLVLNFLPDPHAAVMAMRDRVVSGGCVAAYVWDYAEGMAVIRRFWDTAVAQDPSARPLDERVRFPLCRPEPLAELFARAGMTGVATVALVIPTVFRDFDDLWQPFLGGQGPAPGYLAGLPQARRDDLRERLRERLLAASAEPPVVAPDGSIHMSARAWAVRGRVER
jgi:trans-aconitate methyltransferase